MLSMLSLRFLSKRNTLLYLLQWNRSVAMRSFSNSLNSSILKQMKSSYECFISIADDFIDDMKNCLNGWRNRQIYHAMSI